MQNRACALIVCLGFGLLACASNVEVEENAVDESNFIVGKSLGEGCSINLQCGSGLVCRPKTPGAKDLTCEPIGEAGDGCDEDKDCMGGDPKAAHKARTGGCKQQVLDGSTDPVMACWRGGRPTW